MEKKMTTKTNQEDIAKLREDVTKLRLKIIEITDELKRTNHELVAFKKLAHRDVVILQEGVEELDRRTR
jgi:hypothetical protein